MATTDIRPRFVDTNVLVYANQIRSIHHARAVSLLAGYEQAGAPLWISAQVLREYLAAVTRPNTVLEPLPMSIAIQQARLLAQRFWLAEDNGTVRAQMLTLLAAYPTAGRQVHGADLVDTMLVHGITHLLTFNTADFRRFGALITIEPGP